MPKHIARLIVLMVGFAAAAYAAKQVFTADSFYRYGHYRGDSVQEIALMKPRHLGASYCAACHSERYAEWSQGVHHSPDGGRIVQCEVCHGVAGGRDTGGAFVPVSTGVDHPASGKLAIPSDTRQLCPLCHERIVGRPAEQRQVVIDEHAGTQQCTACHNPHSPRLMKVTAPATGASPSAKASACAPCHGSEGVSANGAWPNLAGQHDAYLLETLKAYRTGVRGNATMAAVAKVLSDADMQELAGYFAGLRAKPSARNVAYGNGAANTTVCAGCHGEGGVSSNPAWPNLAGQQKGYIVAALRAYKDGTRKNEVMAGIAKSLSPPDIEALANHFAGLDVR